MCLYFIGHARATGLNIALAPIDLSEYYCRNLRDMYEIILDTILKFMALYNNLSHEI